MPFPSPLEPGEEWYTSPQLDHLGEPNLTIRSSTAADGQRFVHLSFGGNSKFAEYLVSYDACYIYASWLPSSRFEDIVWLLLRPVMSMVLWLRGTTCLHASVVAVNDSAIALLGSNGAGKSSLAAAFARNGYSVLADDVAVLQDGNDHFLVHPTYPTLALARSTASTLLGATELPPLWAGEDKRYVAMTTAGDSDGLAFEPRPLPLAAIYFLGPRCNPQAAPSLERVTPANGLVRLLGHRFLRAFGTQERRSRQFDLLGRVAKYVPLYALHAPNNLANISDVCNRIIRELN